MSDSAQHKLDRIRKPYVHITTDLYRGDATSGAEIPFVMGILGDFSGKTSKPLARLKDRAFQDIDSDSFDNVMATIAPRLEFNVDNLLAEGGEKLKIELNIDSMASLAPDRVARQVKELRELIDKRDLLAQVLNDIETKPRFGERLDNVLGDSSKSDQLRSEVQNVANSPTTPEPAEDK